MLNYRIARVEKRHTLGKFPTWSTAAAREEARKLRRVIDAGIDPIAAAEQDAVEGMTVKAFWDRIYLPIHVPTRRPSWQRDIVSLMTREILPRLGSTPIRDIDPADVTALHRAITRRGKPYRANRALAVVSHLLSYAESPHIPDDGQSPKKVPALRLPRSNPCHAVVKNAEERRERYLSAAEIERLTAALDRHPGRAANIVRLLMMTGARFGEVTGAHWSQFDFDAGTWTRASHETKQKKRLTTPLPAPALALLASLPRDGELLFPGPDGKGVKSIRTSWLKICRDAQLTGLRVHDLRHSYGAMLASSGASLLWIGKLLGHSQAATTERYSHVAPGPLRELAERAGAGMSAKPSAEVVPLDKARRG